MSFDETVGTVMRWVRKRPWRAMPAQAKEYDGKLACLKNSLDGWSGRMADLPMARASAVAVQSTSDVDGLIKTRYSCMAGWAWSTGTVGSHGV